MDDAAAGELLALITREASTHVDLALQWLYNEWCAEVGRNYQTLLRRLLDVYVANADDDVSLRLLGQVIHLLLSTFSAEFVILDSCGDE